MRRVNEILDELLYMFENREFHDELTFEDFDEQNWSDDYDNDEI